MSPFSRSAPGDPSEPRFGEPVEISVDGVPVAAVPGQTVAAALMATGRDSWRTTRGAERPRGVFCGIGACFDCLVVVNGTPDVRACQRTIQPGDAITTQAGAQLPTRTGAAQPTQHSEALSFEVVVVGAGPAGLTAALAAAETGVSVGLVDAGRAVGGQFHRQLPTEFAARRPERLQHGWARFVQLRDRVARHHRITQLAETSVWAIEEIEHGHRLWAQTGPADAGRRGVRAVDGRALVLAPGAYDRVLPFKGWDLPGVYSAGAAQALAKGQRIAVGQRVVLAGTGPFLLPVAESLVGVGAEVAGMFEANSARTIARGWSSDPLVARGKIGEAAGYAGLLARHRIRPRTGWTVVAAHGDRRVEAVTVAKLDHDWRPIRGTEQQLEADAVCVGFGFTAQLELAVSTRCELTAGPDGGPAVRVDEHQQTSTPGVFAAGELTGIGGADLAAAEGRVAGAAAARFVTGSEAVLSQAHEEVAKGKRFAAALAAAHPVRPGWVEWSDDETLICRCEEVSRGELRRAAADRELLPGRSLKLSSRVGLGMCQGRICSRNATCLTSPDQNAVVRNEFNRPIAVPVRLKDLANPQEDQ
ncbi:FAD-dependent pyridine nucleotide-disulphide oxidoreductase [Kribbella flavida DSM 17836]|uniref:FAD-dependent pyridine nucleotide-disulphide oxidoreductase n=1 Tax=Kribbella flavida (strain DSM 17836 / JCM 10339 / NBRC 14399) TaxID=479435 RepID=D2PZI5_KRIFD|nr:2Fe-2S iron-sulfur cluster-binding protein [Kribbella flavida]ADB35551.1 FAD-dependent pyridine nucleotide-disulphide oxidoreductase [Kribbella flavida DSM 17836]